MRRTYPCWGSLLPLQEELLCPELRGSTPPLYCPLVPSTAVRAHTVGCPLGSLPSFRACMRGFSTRRNLASCSVPHPLPSYHTWHNGLGWARRIRTTTLVGVRTPNLAAPQKLFCGVGPYVSILSPYLPLYQLTRYVKCALPRAVYHSPLAYSGVPMRSSI